jgi:hypothetical protein
MAWRIWFSYQEYTNKQQWSLEIAIHQLIIGKKIHQLTSIRQTVLARCICEELINCLVSPISITHINMVGIEFVFLLVCVSKLYLRLCDLVYACYFYVIYVKMIKFDIK